MSNAKVWLQIPSIKLWGDDDVVGDFDDDNEDEEEEYTMMMISSEVPLGVRSPNETVDSAAPAALPTTLRIAKVDDDGNDYDDDEYESNNDGVVEPIDKDTPKDKKGDKT